MSRIYLVHEHHASRLHWDLRLQKDGKLKSWALPKEPPVSTGVRRLAIQVEDHELSYAQFEGNIPEGSYGAGRVKIWDDGMYLEEKWDQRKILILISGKKLSGRFALVMLPDKKNWLFFRTK